MKTLLSIFVTFALLLTVARADELGDAQRRIQGRRADVTALKESGVLGENNRGYLEVRGDATAQANEVVAGENKDREILYSVVAKRTNASVDFVGRSRAKEIAASSRPGIWIQDEAGKWAKK